MMRFTFKKIDHILIAAPKGSEEAARQFFTKILSFKEVEKPDSLKRRGGVWFANENIQIHIGIEEPFIPAKKAHPAFEVENIENLKQHLLTQGITVQDDENLPGAKRFFIFDPFGNRIEFLEWTSKRG